LKLGFENEKEPLREEDGDELPPEEKVARREERGLREEDPDPERGE
jgi:hypothetical protein